MPRANLTLTVPEGVWIGDVSRAYPEAEFTVLAAVPGEDSGVGLAELTAADPGEILSAVETAGSVTELEVFQRAGDTALFQFETTMPLLLLPLRESGIPLEFPFTIRDGSAEWEVTASQDRLSELADRFEAYGVPFTVNEVRQRVEPDRLLTDRQRRLLEAAVSAGYYDTPRRTTLTELADSFGVAKSTASETLHRAEGRVLKRFVEDLDTRPASPDAD